MQDPDAHLARCLPPPRRQSPHRAAPIELPSDPAESAALVVRLIQTGATAFDRSGAIEAVAARLSKLRDADPEVALAELAGHVAVLDALFQTFAVRAVMATNTDAASKFGKLSLAAQSSYTRTLIAYEGLKQQRRGKASIAIEADHDDDLSGQGET